MNGSFKKVFERGDAFLNLKPRRNPFWRLAGLLICLFTVLVQRFIMTFFYKVKLNNEDRFGKALERARKENRGIITIMNHMSMVDEPAVWAALPLKNYYCMDRVRWCLGADNVLFSTKFTDFFFSAGQVLSTKRFGGTIFQGSIDAAIRLLSPDEDVRQMENESDTKNYVPPIPRNMPAWVHVYPEGFVLQLHKPHSNSMRYFHWGVSRLILESTKPPIILPLFSTGFEKYAPEPEGPTTFKDFLPQNLGSEINVTVGNPIDDSIIESYREKWQHLCNDNLPLNKNSSQQDLTDELKYGKSAEALRSDLASFLRTKVAEIRHKDRGLPLEDERFKQVSWWEHFTKTNGKSAPDVKLIGYNWANRKLQSHLPDYDYDDSQHITEEEQNILNGSVPIDNFSSIRFSDVRVNSKKSKKISNNPVTLHTISNDNNAAVSSGVSHSATTTTTTTVLTEVEQ
ncbi:hypothetical protein TBLA_0C03930 [Henningerozyma blattae CBS 6284]|uniref:Tafazzin family protein n=1 Tax=Henningerozyma blattae (strain ATCC 34711 / CBS 6284 / DSM 70876 / NBRC 10599 / NRRL Y-10934 / UCD 77-7) TaxID=1071380 RepID=I2H1E2_HENB6|nr:hypothetical protein TBLA_0C03930 [Tetrapisispora blattae CBS 6284]CCH60194.1 hypothetical protein TBLA_0C03930 [Tetrapisispora blattae CBS 6284]